MEKFKKFAQALQNLKPDTEYSYSGDVPTSEELFNNVDWITGVENGVSVTTKVNPHPELAWSLVLAEMNRLQTEYNNLVYARARLTAYPDLKDFIEAYTEKEIGGDSTKWDDYVTKYNKVRSDNPKP
tara:strand:- start:297 stop:677 length:381 start_codon:yes stop_codon:yes gene_type:complete